MDSICNFIGSIETDNKFKTKKSFAVGTTIYNHPATIFAENTIGGITIRQLVQNNANVNVSNDVPPILSR